MGLLGPGFELLFGESSCDTCVNQQNDYVLHSGAAQGKLTTSVKIAPYAFLAVEL
jgi:hypothetical protein